MAISATMVTGAIVGCAVGDAIGAPFEGLWSESIPSPESLLEGYHEYHGYPRGQYTDDTQLTVATVQSVVACDGIDLGDIARRIAHLWKHHEVIGPGGACTEAAEHFLATGDWSSMGAEIGQAGNGTAMRTAVLGLLYADDPDRLRHEVAAISRLTHNDPRSVAGGVVIAEAARYLACHAPADPELLCRHAADAARPFSAELADDIQTLSERYQDDSVREFIASAGLSTPEFAQPIITPFVVPTVLASLYCLLRYPDSWPQAVTGAIRLGGDVDTLGAIVGSLAGIRHGAAGIPSHLATAVQDYDKLQVLAARYYEVIRASCGRDHQPQRGD